MTARTARWFSSACAVVVALGLAGCRVQPEASGQPKQAGAKLVAVATTGMVADAVARVGGEHVAVEALMGPGVDPHLYKATEGDLRRLASADLVFLNGLHLEAKMADVLEHMKGKAGQNAVAIGEAIPKDRLLGPDTTRGDSAVAASAGFHDPHIWFDAAQWSLCVQPIVEALAKADPGHKEEFEGNAKVYKTELLELDSYARAHVASIPDEQRVLVTAHDAFRYFGRAYRLEVRGLQGISTASEAGARDVDDLAKFLVERKIPAIFIESSVPRRNVEALQEAVKARGFEVRIGGELFSDALGSRDTPEGTYIGMVRHNVDTIVGALSGKASPPAGSTAKASIGATTGSVTGSAATQP